MTVLGPPGINYLHTSIISVQYKCSLDHNRQRHVTVMLTSKCKLEHMYMYVVSKTPNNQARVGGSRGQTLNSHTHLATETA